ncbi:unnamed protein product [Blepharisma stoltei]|uniref:DNA mismatch repair proteins mutS family domain-containing protein n=1 Tax=Blepharisma stoltei TaxID=1481888 RepID=A0AAU9IZC2_9CILI|nr:unnamed protein product [Blepharisma stoltei]
MSETSSIYLSVFTQYPKLGIAKFDESTGHLEVSEIWVTVTDFSFLSPIFIEIEPSYIIASNTAPEQLKEILENFNTTYMPKSEFDYNKAKQLTTQQCFQGDEFKATTSLNFSCNAMISSIGALISYLTNSSNFSSFSIQKVYQIKISGLHCDFQTLKALQIIQEDSHPSKINNAGRSKEGLSIFGLFDNTCTTQGRKKLRQWLLRPLGEISEINARLEAIEFFMKNPGILQEILHELKNVSDLEICVKRFYEVRTTTNDWLKVIETSSALLRIVEILKKFEVLPLMFLPLINTQIDLFIELLTYLQNCLDFSNKDHGKPQILSGVSAELDYLKRSAIDLDNFLIQLSNVEKLNLKKCGIEFASLSVMHFPQLGYHIEISYRGRIGLTPSSVGSDKSDHSLFEKIGYEYQFAADDAIYFKNDKTKSLDDRFGDLKKSINDTENAILRDLETEILKRGNELCYVSRLLGDLDALLSLVLAAETLNLTRPQLQEEPGIQIVNGRHLLVEICVDNAIPNDCALDSVHKIAVICGPNYSGKSVYMKMVGLIVYLAHIGSFVPAEFAVIGKVDQIFSRMAYSDSRTSSSFSEEIAQLTIALNNSTPSSLLILDEFGKGTNSIDGMSLVGSLLSHLQVNSPPLTLLCTHFQELITHSLISESEIMKFYTMEIAYSDHPVFLYKLIRGKPMGSFGIFCAKWAGISEEVIKRAEEVKESFRNGKELRPLPRIDRIEKSKQVLRMLSHYKDGDSPEDFLGKALQLMTSPN